MRLLTAILLALATSAAAPLAAQVGHPPGSSPYRDLLRSRSVSGVVSDIGGDGGRVGVGPHNGRAYGLRFDIRLGTPAEFGLSLSRAQLERLVVSAAESVATRVAGPVDQDLTMIEATLQLNLTGRKSWHGLAPFLGGAVGVADGADLTTGQPQDSSGFRFGTKIYLAPYVGTRLYLGSTLFVRLEARQLFWKLTYPVSYTLAPAEEPTGAPVLPDGKRDEWSGGREFRAGVGFAF